MQNSSKNEQIKLGKPVILGTGNSDKVVTAGEKETIKLGKPIEIK